MESNIHSKIIIISSTIILASALLIVIAGIPTITTTFVNVYAQGEGGEANQTMQQQQEKEDPQQSANKTMEKAIQSANETGEDAGKVGSQLIEGAKDMIGGIGEKLQELGK